MKKMTAFFFLALALNANIYSEIEQITLRWVALRCQAECVKLLAKEFGKIQGVDEIAIDPGSGQATLTWKEKMPFQYTSVNTAMHMVGLSLRDIRIKVRGTLRHTGDVFFIISKGDNTRFDLINPVIPYPSGVAVEYNAAARKISPALAKQLLEAEAQRLDATIEGPVFMPERMTIPTQIVVDKINFSDPNAVKKQ